MTITKNDMTVIYAYFTLTSISLTFITKVHKLVQFTFFINSIWFSFVFRGWYCCSESIPYVDVLFSLAWSDMQNANSCHSCRSDSLKARAWPLGCSLLISFSVTLESSLPRHKSSWRGFNPMNYSQGGSIPAEATPVQFWSLADLSQPGIRPQ